MKRDLDLVRDILFWLEKQNRLTDKRAIKSDLAKHRRLKSHYISLIMGLSDEINEYYKEHGEPPFTMPPPEAFTGIPKSFPTHCTIEKFHYHCLILHEAKLIKAFIHETPSDMVVYPLRLTWDGHELLDAIRNESFWKKVKKNVKEKAGTAPLDLIKQLTIMYAKSAITGGEG